MFTSTCYRVHIIICIHMDMTLLKSRVMHNLGYNEQSKLKWQTWVQLEGQ